MTLKIIYMGTPDFAVLPLRALAESGYEIAAVVTQPDKPKGRGKTMLPTPVKEEAQKYDIPVITVPLALVAQPLNCLPEGAVKPLAGSV